LLFRTNRLLNRANGSVDVSEDNSRQVLPTVTGFAARRAIAALRRRNVAIAALLQSTGLSERDIDNGQHRISALAQGKLLEAAADALADSALGLHLAKQANPREAGLLYYVASAAKNLGEALVLFERYFRIVNEAVHLKLTRAPKGVVAEVSFVGVSRHHVQQNADFGIAMILKALREVTGRNIRPTKVTFVVLRRSDLQEFERFYGCPVEFGAPSDRLVFSNETVALPLITEDRYLLETLGPVCDAAARERDTPKGTLRAIVENEVERLLPHGKTQKRIVAKALGLGARTLSRRLADEGTTYEEVVDQLRLSLGLQYLKEPSLSLSQIAWLLGYGGSTSFNHAFRRWTGRPPSAMRREKQRPGHNRLDLVRPSRNVAGR
jgi:AraC-like DNA-binding protein